MEKAIVGMVGIGVVAVGGYFMLSQNNPDQALSDTEGVMMEEQAMSDESMVKNDGGMMEADSVMKKDVAIIKTEDMKMESESMMKKDDSMMESAGDTMMQKGVYAPYDESKLAMAATGDVVLFFKASWCPSCRALDANIKANLDQIPAGLTILEVDYDSSTALRQKYGVTTQHTLVQVDVSGTLIQKWSGTPTLAGLVDKVQ